MTNFKEQYEAGIAAIRCNRLVNQLYDGRIYQPVMSCRDQAPQFLVDVLMSGITLAFYNGTINDRFDRTKFELCFQLMEAPGIDPSHRLQAAWQLQRQTNSNIPTGIIREIWSSGFKIFDDNSVAALFESAFLVMYDLQDMNSVDFFNAETFMDFCDVADSLTIVRQRWI